MKKYTNKILTVTLIAITLLFVISITVEIRKSFHNNLIKRTEDTTNDFLIPNDTNVIIVSDSIEAQINFIE